MNNLQKLLVQRNGHRKIIARQIERFEEEAETSAVESLTALLAMVEEKSTILQCLDNKILEKTEIDTMEEEMIQTGDYTTELMMKLAGFRKVLEDRRSKQEEDKSSRTEEDVGSRKEEDRSLRQGDDRSSRYEEDRSLRQEEDRSSRDEEERTLEGMERRADVRNMEQSVGENRCNSSSGEVPEIVSNISYKSRTMSAYKLPTLSLPTFDGNILHWQTFWDIFESTVHLNSNLTDVQKFVYLKGQLESEASRTIEGFPLTNSNYTRAAQLLRERYGQRHKLVHVTMQALLQIPAPVHTLHSMRTFYDTMETYVRSLESLGRHQESYGDLLVPIVLEKVPGEIRQNLARAHGDDNWTLADLRTALHREINIMEAGSRTRVQPEVEAYAGYGTATSLFAGTTHQRQNNISTYTHSRRQLIKCAFCDENHIATDCRKFADAGSRLDVIKKKRLCFNCLGKHQVSSCISKSKCKNCNKKHHTSICRTGTSRRFEQKTSEQRGPEIKTMHASNYETSPTVLLKTAIAPVCYNEICTDAEILFDEGSQRSFITEKLATELKLPRETTEAVHLSSFGGKSNTLQNVDTATVYLVTDKKKKIPIRVLIVPTIATPIDDSCRSEVVKLPYLKGLRLAHPVTKHGEFKIEMLIGADFYWSVVEDKVIRGDGPTAVKSKIGYLLSGPVHENVSRKRVDHIFYAMTSRAAEEKAIERFWNLESIGITDEIPDRKLKEDVQQYQESSIELIGDKYTARLPWKPDHDELPSNYDIVLKRTHSTIRRLSRNPEMLQNYGDIIAEQEKRGFIERVEEDTPTSNTVHYIPHHSILKESSTTPIRIVYDCSCRQSPIHPSLNDCLESTPPVLNELTSILMRFRLHKFAVTTDIEKAFLNVELHEDDRDATRFLWLSDPSDPDSQLVTYRFKAVLFGATCSPFMLNATILKHLNLNRRNAATETLERDLYVDNVLSSFSEEADVVSYFRDARGLMKRASMNLRSWSTNCPVLRDMAENEGLLNEDEVTKVLGLRWEPEVDTISFAQSLIPELDTVTKRDILKHSSRIYDPLGLLSPVTVRAKLLLQETWKGKYDWDVPLPSELQVKWKSLAQDLNVVTKIKLSRQYLSEPDHKQKEDNTRESTSLHVFVDASVKSYGAAVYISDKKETRLVMAKNRVAPVKSMTLPQLELMAAAIGARLAVHVQHALDITDTTFWSDSQIVLHWLSTSKPQKRFVRNRIQEIQRLTKKQNWHYCPTHDNPADLLTRGITAQQLVHNRLWNNGPVWITSESSWPVWEVDSKKIRPESDDVTTSSLMTSSSNDVVEHPIHSVINSLQCTTKESVSRVVDIDRFSSYPKLLRVTVYVERFIMNCRHPDSKLTGTPSVAELERAEQRWLRSCQEDSYHDEIASLQSQTATRLSLVKQLRLFIDCNGLLRCGGRIHNAPLSDAARFPYLLPKKHTLTRLIVSDTHENQLHAGTNATATQIRQKYWIPAIRQCVKAILHRCVICKRVQGKPYRAPDPPPLPKIRVEESPPFTVTGVDYTGALYVRDRTGTETKVYICLFTCASTRAVHLEIVQDLSTESFLQAFRRFVSRRSLPKIVMSDNATNFTGASQHLKHLFESASVREELNRRGTEWRFIPTRAPWFGGWWERLIGLTKSSLKKILGRALVTMETLQTVVTEIEAVLNDRPLTPLSSSTDDLEPLTPSHLINGRRLTSLPYNSGNVNIVDSPLTNERQAMKKRLNQQTTLLDQFWKRWRMEYLTALREYHRKSGINTQTINIGDVVQIHEDCPRSRWKLGVVEELVTGRDNLTRAAIVRTGRGRSSRPIVKLYPLEVRK